MRIVVVGPGAIGCLFAGLLSEAKRDVWLLDKNAARAKAIAENGVRIDDDKGSRVIRVKISAETDSMGRAGLVLVCVKSYDVSAAIRHALPVVGPETIVVPLENGSGNVERIAEVVGGDQIACGITSHGSTRLGRGHVRHAGVGPTMIAAFVPAQRERAGLVADFLTASGIEARVADDMQSMIWNKLIVNAAINPLTAISNVRNGQLLENPDLRETMRKAAVEAAEVARAKDVHLAYGNEVEEVEKVCRETANNFSSMLQDVRRGRRTEIDSISGVIVEAAHAAGIAVPMNEMLLERVRGIEERIVVKKATLWRGKYKIRPAKGGKAYEERGYA